MTTENTPNKKKTTAKQIVAMLGIIILVAMYLLTLIFAIIAPDTSRQFFTASLIATFCVPVLIWIFVWMYGVLTQKKTFADPAYNIGANTPVQPSAAQAETEDEASAPSSEN